MLVIQRIYLVVYIALLFAIHCHFLESGTGAFQRRYDESCGFRLCVHVLLIPPAVCVSEIMASWISCLSLVAFGLEPKLGETIMVPLARALYVSETSRCSETATYATELNGSWVIGSWVFGYVSRMLIAEASHDHYSEFLKEVYMLLFWRSFMALTYPARLFIGADCGSLHPISVGDST